ncbi:phosphoglycerate mutase [Lactobacillus nasalidis]|uniref:Phosphoglycerate mutase n=1 Tax=Lactobacillus nasalidis TaxID=2797258 RepID=A0ABQ3W3M5_9LACO|nr:histidine phosphatase family protein [Lactobacillus nasalidis]GHV98215.1 phosphoglycerate mutase [Lactobacillus nasalidis]GHV99885.1 phosphoglycerate mutase [Lactobacillus nasalidis]GHW01038.1 phosphoglycerate mutase [Lactobacillus nasalidis]
MEIYFVRHGKTQWNLEQRFQGGQGDSKLLPESLADIQKLGSYLKNTHFQGLYSSPLDRARMTAQGIADAAGIRLPLHIDERLREMNLGKLEGMKYSEAEKLYPQEIDNFWHHPDAYDSTVVAGESYEHAMERGLDFGREMARKYPKDSDKVLVVSHGAVLSAIMGALLGYDLANLRQNGVIYNTSVSVLRSQETGADFKLVKWADVTPLGHKMSETDGL